MSLNKIRPQSPMEKLSSYLWSMLLCVYSPPTKNSAVDSFCQYLVGDEGEVEVVELGAVVAGGVGPVGAAHVLGKCGRFLKRLSAGRGSVKF